uniref:Uncharacterized protein n=1 Tax=Tetraselmis sp. GSL018 TaxID=582737 RepID=A0A061SD60_9CHLO|eukprot:CAMPEP_0177594418 /NCGR_PEP_ID=MMETSP0419_2-20121207/9770_1 /TAXON_ID=582737 /ORGANISM="Tetraselmis sp., Strain GSL018" /LENGTH=221 /DNA_ID=CAMNT_0019085725 /DNA_START=465 /DNA_END=1130 /DNA_ORIENTATION=-
MGIDNIEANLRAQTSDPAGSGEDEGDVVTLEGKQAVGGQSSQTSAGLASGGKPMSAGPSLEQQPPAHYCGGDQHSEYHQATLPSIGGEPSLQKPTEAEQEAEQQEEFRQKTQAVHENPILAIQRFVDRYKQILERVSDPVANTDVICEAIKEVFSFECDSFTVIEALQCMHEKKVMMKAKAWLDGQRKKRDHLVVDLKRKRRRLWPQDCAADASGQNLESL